MTQLLIATGNQGKLREIKEILKDTGFVISSLKDLSSHPEIVEDGKTFQANAIKKALTISRYTGKLVMGEDSGLEVKTLGNRPGVFSARFSGPQATDKKNNAKLLRVLRGVPLARRVARYRCCIALAKGDEVIGVVQGSCGGLIAQRQRGTNGFGYDPLFLVRRYNKTFGELAPSIKARISHRARALKKFQTLLDKYLYSCR